MNATSIDHLVTELERHRTVFLPSKTAYLDYIFNFACDELERVGTLPHEDPLSLRVYMRAMISHDLERAREQYEKRTTYFKLYVPVYKKRNKNSKK